MEPQPANIIQATLPEKVPEVARSRSRVNASDQEKALKTAIQSLTKLRRAIEQHSKERIVSRTVAITCLGLGSSNVADRSHNLRN